MPSAAGLGRLWGLLRSNLEFELDVERFPMLSSGAQNL
jgi:hypothetical protein